MKNLAIIPARGGSKRIPGKNIYPFHGKPLISYAINIAIQSKLFQNVMVSTDDTEIADISKEYGAEIPFFRSEKNSDHFAGIAEVVNEVISEYSRLNEIFDHVCCVLPTAPLLTVKNLHKGYDILLSNKFNSVRPVVRYGYPVQRAYRLKDGMVEFFYPEHEKTRSQDLEPVFHDAGQFYWCFFEKGMVKTKRGGFEISELEAQDIDNFIDLQIAEVKYSILNRD